MVSVRFGLLFPCTALTDRREATSSQSQVYGSSSLAPFCCPHHNRAPLHRAQAHPKAPCPYRWSLYVCVYHLCCCSHERIPKSFAKHASIFGGRFPCLLYFLLFRLSHAPFSPLTGCFGPSGDVTSSHHGCTPPLPAEKYQHACSLSTMLGSLRLSLGW